MKLKDFEFPLYLVKFCEKEEFADDLIAGRLYMKASGYFRSLPGEDEFRGDPCDGKLMVDIGDEEAYIEPIEGDSLDKRIYLNGRPGVKITNMTMGFEGDDRIPIFCACLMSDEILEKTSETTFRVRREYTETLARFGRHAVLIPFSELCEKLQTYRAEHPDIAFKGDRVKYIENGVKPESVSDNDSLQSFFMKRVSYKPQNEWRLIAYRDNPPLLGEEADHWICDVGAFQYAVKLPPDHFLNAEIGIKAE